MGTGEDLTIALATSAVGNVRRFRPVAVPPVTGVENSLIGDSQIKVERIKKGKDEHPHAFSNTSETAQ